MLIILAGLPGSGKTSIAQELARQIGGVHLRIDSIEQAIRVWGAAGESMTDVGYRVAYAVAEDNLKLGRTVVADSVNPLTLTRDAWIAVADRAGVRAAEVEIHCSNQEEHRRRVETRVADIAGFVPPTWRDVTAREYHPWSRERIVLDTAGKTVAECVEWLRKKL